MRFPSRSLDFEPPGPPVRADRPDEPRPAEVLPPHPMAPRRDGAQLPLSLRPLPPLPRPTGDAVDAETPVKERAEQRQRQAQAHPAQGRARIALVAAGHVRRVANEMRQVQRMDEDVVHGEFMPDR